MPGSMCDQWGVWLGGMHGWGVFGWGVHGHGGMHAWVCVHGQRACVAGEMATTASGMHPTGMHSCFWLQVGSYLNMLQRFCYFVTAVRFPRFYTTLL